MYFILNPCQDLLSLDLFEMKSNKYLIKMSSFITNPKVVLLQMGWF